MEDFRAHSRVRTAGIRKRDGERRGVRRSVVVVGLQSNDSKINVFHASLDPAMFHYSTSTDTLISVRVPLERFQSNKVNVF
jgi:hypothetical protein